MRRIQENRSGIDDIIVAYGTGIGKNEGRPADPYQSIEIRGAVSSSREINVVIPTVTVTTTGWSPALSSVAGRSKSNTCTPGSNSEGLFLAAMVTPPTLIDISAALRPCTPVIKT